MFSIWCSSHKFDVFPFVMFWSAVSFEIPDLPEAPDVNLPATVAQSLISETKKLGRTLSSSSSTASSCSSYHTPLSKANRYCTAQCWIILLLWWLCNSNTFNVIDNESRGLRLELFSAMHPSEAKRVHPPPPRVFINQLHDWTAALEGESCPRFA